MRARLACLLLAAAATLPPLARAAAQPPVRGRPVATPPLAPPARPAWALEDSADADAVVRVVIENGPQATLVGLGRDTMLLLPVRQVFGMLEIAMTVDVPGRRLAGLVDPELPPVGFNTDTRRLEGRDSVVSFRNADVAWQQGELYATPALLARALRVRADVDLGSLTVTFMGVREMPVLRRLERVRQRTLAWRTAGAPPPFAVTEDRPRVFDGAVLDWSFLSPLDQPSRLSSARLALGAQLFGGGVELQQQQSGTEPFSRGETTWNWTRAWQDRRWVRQLGLGSVNTSGRRPRAITGAMVTNVPYFRAADYADEWLQGRLPAGWELEIQRYGAPVGTVRPDAQGAWRFNVPTSYGPNEIELLAYGPGGASRRWRENVVVPFERLPRGKLEYVAAAGACRFEQCDRTGTVDLRYGVTDWLTVHGGTNEFALRDGTRFSNPFALASVGIIRSLNLTAEHVAGGLTRGEFDFQPNLDFRVTVGATRFDTSASSQFVNVNRASSRVDARLFWRPYEARRGWWGAATLWREERAGVATTSEQLTASATRGPARVQGSLIFGQTALAGSGPSVATQQEELIVESAVLSPWTFTRGLYGRASALFEADGSLAQVSALLFNSFSRRFRIEGGVLWVRSLSSPIVRFQVQANLPSFQLVTTTQVVAGQVVGAQTLSGTAQYDGGRRRVQVGNDLANGRGLGYGGVEGELFVDANGNGKRDTGEAGVPNVHVTIGSQQVTTDGDGWFTMGTLLSYVPTVVEVDTVSLPNPMWMTERAIVGVVPRPNSFLRLSIPVRPGGGIVGIVEYADRSRGPAGAEIEVVNVETRDMRRVVTFSDGSFEAYKLRPGTYEVSPSNATLRRARARSLPLQVVVRENNDAAFVESVTLPLVPELAIPAPVIEPIALPPAFFPDTLRRLATPAPAGTGRGVSALRPGARRALTSPAPTPAPALRPVRPPAARARAGESAPVRAPVRAPNVAPVPPPVSAPAPSATPTRPAPTPSPRARLTESAPVRPRPSASARPSESAPARPRPRENVPARVRPSESAPARVRPNAPPRSLESAPLRPNPARPPGRPPAARPVAPAPGRTTESAPVRPRPSAPGLGRPVAPSASAPSSRQPGAASRSAPAPARSTPVRPAPRTRPSAARPAQR
ncbi:MAG: hypothetical protein HYX65_02055 [Gemmatimonadetes bacterium]|nr:hypothetical protein [Gemmatimonadota bacterium]